MQYRLLQRLDHVANETLDSGSRFGGHGIHSRGAGAHSFEQQSGFEPDADVEQSLGGPLSLLGEKLFHDTRLSGTGGTACASCHEPNYAFADPSAGEPIGRWPARATQRPSLINAGLLPALMWDGRFRSLEQQAFSPFARGEMGIDIFEAERRLNSDPEYVHLFRVALNSRPSANGMAIVLAAYQRTLISESRFDRPCATAGQHLTALELDGSYCSKGKLAAATVT